jgi:uncharacterized protein YjdB
MTGITIIVLLQLLVKVSFAQQNATLNVTSGERQTYKGSGFNIFTDSEKYTSLTREQRQEISEKVIEYTNANILRLWLGQEYVNSYAIEDAVNAGIDKVIAVDGADVNFIIQEVKKIKQAGLPIDYVVLMNEPDHTIYPTADHTKDFKTLRKALDNNNLTEVKSMCCDDANVDDFAKQRIDAILNDGEANQYLQAFSTHSYSMAAEADYYSRVLNKGLDWWQTEHSIDGQEAYPDDYEFASNTTNVFLNDLNQGVNYWMYFQGYGRSTKPRPLTHNNVFLAYWDDNSYGQPVGSDWFSWAPQAHYIRQINLAFPYGTKFRRVISTGLPSSDMVWTYSTRSPINAVAGKRPDGGWAIAISNTNVKAPGSAVSYYDDYYLTINIDELSKIDSLNFKVTCSGPENGFLKEQQDLVARNGVINILVKKDELYTLVYYPNDNSCADYGLCPEYQLIDSVILVPEYDTLGLGLMKRYIPIIYPLNTIPYSIDWTSSDTNVAEVSSKGTVKALNEGAAEIQCKISDGTKILTGSINLTIEQISVSGVELNKTSIQIPKMNSFKLIAKVLPEEAHIKSVEWFSSNDSIVSVDQNGIITGNNYGQAEITVRTIDGGYTATCLVEVSDEIEFSGTDIGNMCTVTPGYFSLSTENNTFIIQSGGADVWGNEDQFYFVYKNVSGNCEVIVRIDSLERIDEWTKAGVMIRESLDGNSKHAMMIINGGNQSSSVAAFQRRINTGNETFHDGIESIDGINIKVPAWVKLIRHDNFFAAYSSLDGSNWKLVGAENIEMIENAFVGIMLTSHADCIYANANYSGLVINTNPEFFRVSGVDIIEDSVVLIKKQKVTLDYQIQPDNASINKVLWSSRNSKVAKISSTGEVTAIAAGGTYILVETLDGSFKDSCLVIVNVSSEVDEVNDQSLAVYPIPGQNILNISFNHGVIGSDLDLSVYNVTGQVLIRKKILASVNSLYQLDITELKNGFYLLKVNSSNKHYNIKFQVKK